MAKASRLTSNTFDDFVLKADVPVLVDFWTSWCPPCKVVEPVLDQLAGEYDGLAKVGKLQVDQNPSVGSRYTIQGVPTFIIFHSGMALRREVGVRSKDYLAAMIDEALEQCIPS